MSTLLVFQTVSMILSGTEELGVVKYATEDFAENLCHVASKMIGQSLSSCDKIFSEIFRIGANFQRLFSR